MTTQTLQKTQRTVLAVGQNRLNLTCTFSWVPKPYYFSLSQRPMLGVRKGARGLTHSYEGLEGMVLLGLKLIALCMEFFVCFV